MKITPTMPGNRPTATTAGSSQPRKSTATTTTTQSADDITQAGLQSAQQTLNDQQERAISTAIKWRKCRRCWRPAACKWTPNS